MPQSTFKITLSILIPLYSLIFILFVYLYLGETKQDERLKTQDDPSTSSGQATSTSPSPDLPQIPPPTPPNGRGETPTSTTKIKTEINEAIETQSLTYIKVVDGCNSGFEGKCLQVRSGPGKNFPKIAKLRNDMVLRTETAKFDEEGKLWYKVIFEEWLRFPDRVKGDWYVSADYVVPITAKREKIINQKKFSNFQKEENLNPKKIVVNLTTQKLYAYEKIDGVNKIFLETFISSGLDDTPTPIGNFNIFYKTPSRYMQGPIPGISDQYFDLPGVPWTMYFNNDGAAIHGAYWHDNFGIKWSHGCINLYPYDAETLYKWTNLGTTVIVER